MYWLIYIKNNSFTGKSAILFNEYEELEQYVIENKDSIKVIDIAIPYED